MSYIRRLNVGFALIMAVISMCLTIACTPTNSVQQQSTPTPQVQTQQMLFDGKSYFPLVENFVQNIGKGDSWEQSAKKTETKKGATLSVDVENTSTSYTTKLVGENNPKMIYFFLVHPDGKIGGENNVTGAIQLDLANATTVDGKIRVPCAFSNLDRNTWEFNLNLKLQGYSGKNTSPIAAQNDEFTPSELSLKSFRGNQTYIELLVVNGDVTPSDITRLEMVTSPAIW